MSRRCAPQRGGASGNGAEWQREQGRLRFWSNRLFAVTAANQWVLGEWFARILQGADTNIKITNRF
ncbi:hypothetical protein TNCT_514431, partial [Trichonephila clavata]